MIDPNRQQVIDGFVVDFYCHAAGLVVELDGAVHDTRSEYDAERARILAARGRHVLRISNNRIEREIEAVLQELVELALARVNAFGSARVRKRLQRTSPLPCERSERSREGGQGG